jgi:hypothetical protein
MNIYGVTYLTQNFIMSLNGEQCALATTRFSLDRLNKHFRNVFI